MNRIARRIVARKVMTSKGPQWTVRAQAGKRIVRVTATTFEAAAELAHDKLDTLRHVKHPENDNHQTKRSA